MRCGILTFHNSRNYGAVLQAYALYCTLADSGYDAEIIDYDCDNIKKKLRLWVPNNNLIKSVLQYAFRWHKKMVFDQFKHKYLKKSEYIDNPEMIIDKIQQYDAVIVGSDQVWSEQITGSDMTYYLPGISVKKISYAASAGDQIGISDCGINYIKNFDAVSVREGSLKNYLLEFDISATVCCDPTILSGVECFNDIASHRLKKRGYVFVFMIWDSPALMNNAKRFAKSKGLAVVSSKGSFEFFLHCKPEDFLSWIKNADYVFTNSFHGTVLSLLFHRKFISSISRKDNKINTRVYELLNSLNCVDNILKVESAQIYNIPEPNYEVVDFEMEKLRKSSLVFLYDALNEKVF